MKGWGAVGFAPVGQAFASALLREHPSIASVRPPLFAPPAWQCVAVAHYAETEWSMSVARCLSHTGLPWRAVGWGVGGSSLPCHGGPVFSECLFWATRSGSSHSSHEDSEEGELGMSVVLVGCLARTATQIWRG